MSTLASRLVPNSRGRNPSYTNPSLFGCVGPLVGPQGEELVMSLVLHRTGVYLRVSSLLRRCIGASTGNRRVVVFAHSPAECQRAVRYVKQQLPHVSIHVFATVTPLPETAGLCERVVVARRSIELVLEA